MENTSPTYGSVCSGIEAASVAWEPLGWEPLWFAEIEPFPSAVLAHHWPHVPNLGDFTRIKGGIASGTIKAPDVLVGGTPCQSWSVAGLRKGSEDPRGQLTFAFVQLVEAAMPPAVVWENVPGILSAEGGGAFAQFLDALGSLGYIVNCDILDAQFFGVAQRRRRVFVVCQRADILMGQRTATSWTTLAVLVVAILHDILDALLQESAKGQEPWEFLPESVCVGLRRKMQCFYRHGEGPLQMWLRNLEGGLQSVATAPTFSESHLGDGLATADSYAPSEGTSSSGSSVQEEDAQLFAFLSTSQSWSRLLEGLFATLNPSTTSTVSRTTIESKIYSYVEILPIIAQSIRHLNLSSPGSLKLASSISTVLQKAMRFASHARSANGSLFCDSRIPGPWSDFLRQAERAREVVASARTDCGPEILFEFDGMRRDSPPSRKAGQEPSSDAESGFGGSMLEVPEVAGTLRSGSTSPKAHGKLNGTDRMDLVVRAIAFEPGFPARMGAGHAYPELSGTLRKEPGDNQMSVAFDCKASGSYGFHESTDAAGTLRGAGHGGGHSAVAFAQNTRDEVRLQNGDGQIVGALAADPGMKQTSYVGIPVTSPALGARDFKGQPEDVAGPALIPPAYQVRRLTPTECARLQGFPDHHARIPWRKHPAEECPDGPQYKAYGNSMCTKVMFWLGKRIVDTMFTPR